MYWRKHQKAQEARSKAENSEREFLSATQRVEALTTLLGKCVFQVAPGNPDRLDNEQRYFNWILKNMMLEEHMPHSVVSSASSSEWTLVESITSVLCDCVQPKSLVSTLVWRREGAEIICELGQ